MMSGSVFCCAMRHSGCAQLSCLLSFHTNVPWPRRQRAQQNRNLRLHGGQGRSWTDRKWLWAGTGNRAATSGDRIRSLLCLHRNMTILQTDRVILILSGKGGVGKSTVCAQLAVAMAKEGKRVGLLDIDLCGPSIPVMFGMQAAKVMQGQNGWLPVPCPVADNLLVMSIGFLLPDPDKAVIWRGPKKNAMITQFVKDVDWGPLDVLLIDTPPGTSDEHISVIEALRSCRPPDGAVLVSTPQGLSVGDVRREIAFCRKAAIPITGLIENMSGYVCPNCSECTNIFSKGGGQSLARLVDIPFLGCIPIDPQMGSQADEGLTFDSDSQATRQISRIADSIISAERVV